MTTEINNLNTQGLNSRPRVSQSPVPTERPAITLSQGNEVKAENVVRVDFETRQAVAPTQSQPNQAQTAERPDSGESIVQALNEVSPGGHFFGCNHTMERYSTAFYEPLVADWSNFGTWTERGSEDASTRATQIWKEILNNHKVPMSVTSDKVSRLDAFIEKRTAKGGAHPQD